MTIINHSYGFIFVHVPKAAGTTITDALSKYTRYCDLEIGGTVFGEAIQPAFSERFGLAKHTPYFRIRSVIGEDAARTLFKFSFVRNPFARAASTFNFLTRWTGYDRTLRARIGSFANFEDYVLSSIWDETSGPDDIFRPQFFWLRSDLESSGLGVQFVGKIESLANDFRHVLSVLKLPGLDIGGDMKTLNRSGEFSADYFQNPAVVDKIVGRYAVDFETFGYSKDPMRYASAS